MRGFPKHINTAQDVAVCEQLFPAELAAKKAALETNKYSWAVTGTLAAKDIGKGVIDATHKVETRDDGTIVQLELKVDDKSPAYKLGLVSAAAEVKPAEEEEVKP